MKPDIQQQFFSADENRRRVTFVTFANRVRYGAITGRPTGQRIDLAKQIAPPDMECYYFQMDMTHAF